MRHVYGGKKHALKNFFQLLQLAHVFNELVAREDLLRKLTPTDDGEGAGFKEVFMTVGISPDAFWKACATPP